MLQVSLAKVHFASGHCHVRLTGICYSFQEAVLMNVPDLFKKFPSSLLTFKFYNAEIRPG